MPEDWLVRCEADTDPAHGFLPSRRPLDLYLRNGIVNIDKVAGPTSRQVADWVKKILKANKAGHSGTLDPKVTGVFVVAIDNATKIVPVLLPYPKGYIGTLRLHKPVSEKELKAAFKQFTGKIYQKPPVRSAVKRKLRLRTIYSLELLEMDGKDVLFQVSCEAGTYIRKLCHDLGLILGIGAHMSQLRRTKTGPFDESSLVTLQKLSEAKYLFDSQKDESLLRKYVQPVEAAVRHIPKIVVQDSAVEALCTGAKLLAPGIVKLQQFGKGDTVVVLTLKGELICLATAEQSADRIMKMNKGICAKVNRVILPAGTYPKMWKSKSINKAPPTSK